MMICVQLSAVSHGVVSNSGRPLSVAPSVSSNAYRDSHPSVSLHTSTQHSSAEYGKMQFTPTQKHPPADDHYGAGIYPKFSVSQRPLASGKILFNFVLVVLCINTKLFPKYPFVFMTA